MKKSEWSDNELERLLREMPKIKDHRDPRDIYQNLSLKANNRRKTKWIIPTVASAAAVLLLFLLAPTIWTSFSNDSSNGSDVAFEEKSDNMAMKKAENSEAESFDAIPGDDNNNGITSDHLSLMSAPTETAVYEEDLINQKVITYLIPDQNAQILVPVSIMVEDENKSWLDYFQANAGKLTEEQWGLSEYYPLNAPLKMEDQNTLNMDLPEGHSYGIGSASETAFMNILQQTMNDQNNINRITLTTNGKPGIFLGNYGELHELKLENTSTGHGYYLFDPNKSNLPFLAPSVEIYQNIEEALSAMRTDMENYGLKSPLTFGFNVDTSQKPLLIVRVEDQTDLVNDVSNIYAIESILLTAKDFGFKKVKFENTNTAQIGRFNLENELNVPLAPNKVFIQ